MSCIRSKESFYVDRAAFALRRLQLRARPSGRGPPHARSPVSPRVWTPHGRRRVGIRGVAVMRTLKLACQARRQRAAATSPARARRSRRLWDRAAIFLLVSDGLLALRHRPDETAPAVRPWAGRPRIPLGRPGSVRLRNSRRFFWPTSGQGRAGRWIAAGLIRPSSSSVAPAAAWPFPDAGAARGAHGPRMWAGLGFSAPPCRGPDPHTPVQAPVHGSAPKFASFFDWQSQGAKNSH